MQHLNFTLYKENRSDQEYTLNEVELAKKFRKWLKAQDKDWLEYYASRCVISFITLNKNGGLNSTPDTGQMELISEVLEPVRKEYYINFVYSKKEE